MVAADGKPVAVGGQIVMANDRMPSFLADLADVVLPDGRTLGEWAGPQVEEAYRSGAMPALLPGAGPRAELAAAP